MRRAEAPCLLVRVISVTGSPLTESMALVSIGPPRGGREQPEDGEKTDAYHGLEHADSFQGDRATN